MFTILEKFLKPPRLSEAEKQEKAQLLHRLLLSLICLDLIVFIISVLARPEEFINRMALYVLALIVFVFLYILNQRGYPDFTAIVFTGMIFVLVVVAIVLTHRSSFAAATGFLLVVDCAGLLVSRRAALVMAIVSGIISIFMIFLPSSIETNLSEKIYVWLIYVGLLSAGTLLLYLVLESLERGHRKLRERAILLDKINDAVITTSMQGKILSWNRGAEELYGWKAEEVLDKHLNDFVSNDFSQTGMTHTKAFDQLYANGFWQGEVVQKHRNGTTLLLLGSVTLLKDAENNPSGMIAVNRDNRINKELEEQRLYSKILESDLKKEQELSGFKDRILSTVSHEFRTPLAVIQSSVDILRKYEDRLSAEQKEERLQKIGRQINRLLHLLNDVVELGRGNQQQPSQAEAIALRDFCEELIEEYRLMNPNYTIRLEIGQVPPVFHVERRILEHILTNLLSNAIKYSPEGSEIIFSVRESEHSLEFRVDDKGIGIPAAEQAQVFNSFHRAQNVGAIQGTGMGLAIVKQNVMNLDGTIELVSEEGKGSSFVVKLPLARTPVIESSPDSIEGN